MVHPVGRGAEEGGLEREPVRPPGRLATGTGEPTTRRTSCVALASNDVRRLNVAMASDDVPPPARVGRVSDALLAALAGLLFGLSLIVAIGAQNAFVLRQGLRGEHVLLVVTVCAASDAVLIAAGVAGVGTFLAERATLLTVVRVAGAAFLGSYAVLAARRAFRPSALTPADDGATATTTTRVALATVLALTWLNPRVYLDTVLLLGSVAGTHGDKRWAFGAGAALGSVLWFTALGYGAALLRPLFARPAAWRVLDGTIAVIMASIAAFLLAGA
jgi:L-lysine exporter family protein LysE/ArgO